MRSGDERQLRQPGTRLAGGADITPENARFFAAPVPVVLHIPAAIIYSILGALQFSRGFRRGRRDWHRAAGRILIPCGLVVALSGLWMAHFYPWPQGDGQLVYIERLVFGSAMFLSIVLGIDAIRRRDFTSHGEWMIRAYAIGLGAGTQVLTHLPWFLLVDLKPGELPRAVMMGAGWVINVVVAESIIRKRHVRQRSTFTKISMSRSVLKYSLTMFVLMAPISAAAQDKPTLDIVWPKTNSGIALGDDLEKSIGVVVSSNSSAPGASGCASR